MNDGVTLNGRALARNGAVTLINDTITAAHCAARRRARELDLSRALPADAGVGANQGLRPNHAVEQALVEAGVDPTRADWTKSTAGRKCSPGRKATWTQGDVDARPAGRRRERHRRAVGGRDLDVRRVHERRRGLITVRAALEPLATASIGRRPSIRLTRVPMYP